MHLKKKKKKVTQASVGGLPHIIPNINYKPPFKKKKKEAKTVLVAWILCQAESNSDWIRHKDQAVKQTAPIRQAEAKHTHTHTPMGT